MQSRRHDDEPTHLEAHDGTDRVGNATTQVEAVGYTPLLDIPTPYHATLIDRHQQPILIKAVHRRHTHTRIAHLDLPDAVVVLVDLIERPQQQTLIEARREDHVQLQREGHRVRAREAIRNVDRHKNGILEGAPHRNLAVERRYDELLEGHDFLDEGNLGRRFEAPNVALHNRTVCYVVVIGGVGVG